MKKYIKKDIVWALLITLLLFLIGSPFITLNITTSFVMVALVVIFHKYQKLNKIWQRKLMSLARIVSLQNILGLMYGSILTFSFMSKEFTTVYLIPQAGLLVMALVYYLLIKWSLEEERDHYFSVRMHKNLLFSIIAVTLFLFFISGSN